MASSELFVFGVESSEPEKEKTGSWGDKRNWFSWVSEGVKPSVSKNPAPSEGRWSPAMNTSDNIAGKTFNVVRKVGEGKGRNDGLGCRI